MRKFIYILGVLCSTSTLAQIAPIENHTWYLQKIIINGVDYTNPAPNNEVEEVVAVFSGTDNLASTVCSSLDAELDYDNSQNSFKIINSTQTLENCDMLGPNLDFENYYFKDFFLLNNTATSYSYSFSQENNLIKLSIKNINGDQAIYYNQQLSVNSQKQFEINIYPNPMTQNFSLKGLENSIIERIQIFNLKGKLIKTFRSKENNVYDVSNIVSGIYLMKLNTIGNVNFIKKIIIE